MRARLRLHLPEAARPGGARPRAVLPVLRPGHSGAHLRGLRLCRRLLAHRRALDRHRRGSADLPVQVGDPDRRRAGDAPGPGRDRPLHRVPAHRRLAARAEDVEEIDVIDSSSRTASTWTRNRAARRWSGARHRRSCAPPQRHGKASSREAIKTTSESHERSGTRPDDARAHRGRDHDGLSHRLHADGPGHGLRLPRVLRPRRSTGATTGSST